MYCDPGRYVEPFSRNCVHRYISVVLFGSNIRFDKVLAIYFITDCVCVCVCVCYWPPDRGICPNYEDVDFQPRIVTPPT